MRDSARRGGLSAASAFFHEERHASLETVADGLITICGVGALGGNLAETLARMGFRRLRLIDRDRVEMRNLSTQPYSRAEVGAFKARVLANALYRAVQTKAEPECVELGSDNAERLLRGSALVVDALDNRAGRAAVSESVLLLDTPCLHVGFSADGLYGSGVWEPGYRLPNAAEGDPCDYPLTRPLALMLSALAARTVTRLLMTGQREDFELTWRDVRVSVADIPAPA